MFNMEFYDFISGVKHAIIVHEDDTEKEITEGKEYAIDRVNMLKRYLWGIGFEFVAGNDEQVQELIDEKLIGHWAGLRPAINDGKPVIGIIPNFKNIYINAGHFRKGILQAPASAKLLTDYLFKKVSFMDITKFTLENRKNTTESA